MSWSRFELNIAHRRREGGACTPQQVALQLCVSPALGLACPQCRLSAALDRVLANL